MDGGVDIPTDVLACILRRVQPNARRRLRLICKHWWQVIDTRTATSLHSRAMTLVVTMERAYVLDDLFKEQDTWDFHRWERRRVVGTCNGIICMCDHYGGILLHNPVTCEMLALPSMPPRHRSGAGTQTYGFTYDHATGRYMVVHVVPGSSRHCQVVVFTLGEASWRDVSTDGWWCNPEEGFVTVDNTMYWAVGVIGGGVNVVSLDLDGKRVPSVIPLPSSRPAGTLRLTEVRGRLGITFSFVSQRLDKTEVWVMKGGAHPRWSHCYSVQVRHTPRHEPQWYDHEHLTWPHFCHGSNHVITWEWLSTGGCALYRHKLNNDTTKAQQGRVEINERNQGTLVAHIRTEYDTFQTFDYVQTIEPLSMYKCW